MFLAEEDKYIIPDILRLKTIARRYSDVTRNFTLGGLKPNRTNCFLPLCLPSPFPPFPLPFLLASFPSHPLEVGSLKTARGLGERCKLHQWGLGRSPSRRRF